MDGQKIIELDGHKKIERLYDGEVINHIVYTQKISKLSCSRWRRC